MFGFIWIYILEHAREIVKSVVGLFCAVIIKVFSYKFLKYFFSNYSPICLRRLHSSSRNVRLISQCPARQLCISIF